MQIPQDKWDNIVVLVDKVYSLFNKKNPAVQELWDLVDGLDSPQEEQPEEIEITPEENTPENVKAIVTLGRYQPPHLGHQVIFDKMLKEDGHHYVFTGDTWDKDENPIRVDQKAKLIQKVVPATVVVCKGFIDMLTQLNEHYSEVKIIIGEDRREFEELADRYNNKPDKKGKILYHFDKIEFEFVPRSEISGTKVREMAAADLSLKGLVHDNIVNQVAMYL